MKEGWKYCKLSEVCKFFSGFAFKSNKFTEEGMPIIRISDIQNNKIDDSNVVYFNPKDYQQDLSRYIIYPGEILIAMSGGTTGKIGKNETKKQFYLNQRVGAFRENKEILNHDFLYYYLHTKSEESLKIAAGAAQPNLSTAQINSYIIPIPPLSEQQRIVSRLDASFAKIDALSKQAEEALEHAKALFQAKLKKLMEKKDGWEEKKLNEVSRYSIGLTYKPTNVKEKGTIVLRSSNIQNGKLDLHDIVRVDTQIKDTLYVEKGDILMCSRNGSSKLVGKVALIPELKENMTYGAFMMVIKSEYNPYLFYFFQSDLFKNQIKKGEANMINQITRYMLDDVKLCLPPLPEQQQIVQTLDTLSQYISQLEQNYNKTLANCQALKQAILKETFE